VSIPGEGTVPVEAEEEMSAPAELRRIDAVAPWWFATAVIAMSIAVSALVVSGWRPAQLPEWGEFVWWLSSIVTGLGLGCIGYAGCPIYFGNVRTAHRQKSLAIRVGLVLFLVGAFVGFMTVFSH